MQQEILIYIYSKNSLALKILFLIQFNISLKACNFEMRRLPGKHSQTTTEVESIKNIRINLTGKKICISFRISWSLIFLNMCLLQNLGVIFPQKSYSQPVFIFFTVNNENTGTCVNMLKFKNTSNDVLLVSLLSTFNRFHTLFWCFHC